MVTTCLCQVFFYLAMSVEFVVDWVCVFCYSNGKPSPRKELLHNIDLLTPKRGHRFNISKFDNRISAAIRVGKWKLITGDPGTKLHFLQSEISTEIFFVIVA